MLVNYLHIALRNIRRNKLYSLVNIGCLAIGIAVAMMILLYTLHEHSFDRFHANARRIFSVGGTVKFGDASVNIDRLSYTAAPLAQQADGKIEGWLRAYPSYEPVNLEVAAKPGVSFTERDNFIYTDPNFFRFFSFRLLKGNPDRVLERPYTIVLTERAAKKYFGTADPIGRTLKVNGQNTFEVTGVAADPPSNTDIRFDVLASLSSMVAPNMVEQGTVQGGAFKTWLLLKDAGDAAQVERVLRQLSIVPGQPEKDRDVYTLTALADYHLHGNFGETFNLRYLKIFPLVAGLILLLALVNYMSLATARAATRAKEVGVRKVLGAGRSRVALQFYTESALFAVLSFVTGTLLFLLCRPSFFGMLQLAIDPSFLLSPVVLLCTIGLLVLVILLAGSYPSLVLSGFRPVAVLYGRLSRRRGGETVRKGFIVFQFSISMSLVLCSVIIGKELYYIRHTETGIDRDNVVMIPFGGHFGHYEAFKREVEALPGIRQAATLHYPMYKGFDAWAVQPPGSDKPVQMFAMNADNNFIPMLGLQWKERPAAEADLYDGKHLVLNEAAVDKLGLSGDPVGQELKLGNVSRKIAGVLKDFNYQSLHEKIGALSLSLTRDRDSLWGNNFGGCLLGKIQAHTNVPTIVEAIRKIYAKYDKQVAFEYQFMDEAFDSQYKAEDRLAALFGIFTAITIIIACLGLFALATFSAQQRVKEIGIRKVLGASVPSIGALLSRDFLRPVLLAVIIACPLSWWVMDKWLEDFAYRTPLSWWIFPTAGGLMLLIALNTVLFRSLRAAGANPVDNLRSE